LLTSKNFLFRYIVKPLFFIVLFIFLVVSYEYFYGHPLYCMDENIENLLNEISKKKVNCAYFQEQSILYDAELRRVLASREHMDPNQWQALFQESQQANKEANSNLNSEKRMLNILTNKLNSRDFSELTTTPTVQKRKASDI